MNALSRDVECRDEALKASKNASLMRVKEKVGVGSVMIGAQRRSARVGPEL